MADLNEDLVSVVCECMDSHCTRGVTLPLWVKTMADTACWYIYSPDHEGSLAGSEFVVRRGPGFILVSEFEEDRDLPADMVSLGCACDDCFHTVIRVPVDVWRNLLPNQKIYSLSCEPGDDEEIVRREKGYIIVASED